VGTRPPDWRRPVGRGDRTSTFSVTTLLHPMKACSSIVTPQKMVLLIPIEASRLTRVGRFRVCG